MGRAEHCQPPAAGADPRGVPPTWSPRCARECRTVRRRLVQGRRERGCGSRGRRRGDRAHGGRLRSPAAAGARRVESRARPCVHDRARTPAARGARRPANAARSRGRRTVARFLPRRCGSTACRSRPVSTGRRTGSGCRCGARRRSRFAPAGMSSSPSQPRAWRRARTRGALRFEERVAVVGSRHERLLDRARADPADEVPHGARLVVRA